MYALPFRTVPSRVWLRVYARLALYYVCLHARVGRLGHLHVIASFPGSAFISHVYSDCNGPTYTHVVRLAAKLSPLSSTGTCEQRPKLLTWAEEGLQYFQLQSE